jgi:hypothetical protein
MKRTIYLLAALLDILTKKEDISLHMTYDKEDCYILEDRYRSLVEVKVSFTDMLKEYISINYLSWFDVITSPGVNPNHTPWWEATINDSYIRYRKSGISFHQAYSEHHKKWRATKIVKESFRLANRPKT